MFRSKQQGAKQLQRSPMKHYAAVTQDTVFALGTLPRDTRLLLEKVIPVFDAVRVLPASPERWLQMLQNLPDEALTQLHELRVIKPKQAASAVVMLCVYARALLYPADESGLRCTMLDTDVHSASNRIYLFYFPLERFRRLGYVNVEWPLDPFTEWETLRLSYTEAGIAAREELDSYAPAEDTVAGQVVEVPFADLDLV